MTSGPTVRPIRPGGGARRRAILSAVAFATLALAPPAGGRVDLALTTGPGADFGQSAGALVGRWTRVAASAAPARRSQSPTSSP